MKIPLIPLLVLALSVAAPARAETPKERAAKLGKKLATDKNAKNRAEAAKELGSLGEADAAPALAAALKDPVADVRAAAAYSLVQLKDKAKAAAPALEERLAALEAARGNANPRVKTACDAVLAELRK